MTSYDEVPYTSHPYPHSHPERLATIAKMLGLQPPALENCRVLELGCASGNNLIPLAEAWPEARIRGIDLSERQIADGQAVVTALGLKNLELQRRNVLDIPPDEGPYDFIIAHGLYSWVPSEIQDRILSICRQNLAPAGIAYISYNVLPGWRMRGMIRDMMLYHIQRFPDPRQKLQQARALLEFLVKSVPADNNPYGLFLKAELELLSKQTDNYLFHDHLEENNHPVYFHEFVSRAASQGLRYLGDSDLRTMVTQDLHPEAQQLLATSLSQVETEQYMDFLRNRMFRMSLLVHDHQRHNLQVNNQVIRDFYLASQLRPRDTALNPALETPAEFFAESGDTVTITVPLIKAALLVLADAWPRRLSFPDLLAQASERLGLEVPSDPVARERLTDAVGGPLLMLHTRLPLGTLELGLQPLRVVSRAGERPRAPAFARYQAPTGAATNLRHQTVPLDGFGVQILRLLDGTRDRRQILDDLCQTVRTQQLEIREQGVLVTDPERIRAILDQQLAVALDVLTRRSLLSA